MLHFDVASLRATLMQMDQTIAAEKKAARRASIAAGRQLTRFVRKNMSLRDHSLGDLAQMGHPYARRQGSIGIHRGGSNLLTHPEYRVHTQSGTLLSAVHGKAAASGNGYRVFVDKGQAPHAVYVIMGTRNMLGRDVIMSTAQAPEVQRAMMKTIKQKLAPILRGRPGASGLGG